MADRLLADIAAASERGETLMRDEPRAVAARVVDDMLEITLSNTARVAIPMNLIEGLSSASAADRAGVEVAGIGYGLHWPALDLDLSVPGLLAGIFGTARWMSRERAALAGASKSEAKSCAARSNGALGGRPRKSHAVGA